MSTPNPRIPSALGRLLPTSPRDADELKAMRVAAWHKLGMAVISLDELTDDWDRQFLTALANRMYGARTTRSQSGKPWREGETVERHDGEHWTVVVATQRSVVLQRKRDGALETLNQPTEVNP